MKQFFTLVAALTLAITAMAQQRNLVTLSHNGELSFFSNLSALEDALDSAKNGDVIYLSDGQFTAKSETLTITKRVKIVGNGYQSHILPKILINMSNNSYTATDPVLFDGVRLNTITFANSASGRSNLKETEILRSKIGKIENLGYAGTDVRVEGCFINMLDANAASNNNTLIVNSKIKEIDMDAQYITVTNCNIFKTEYWPRYTTSCIINAVRLSGNTSPQGLFYSLINRNNITTTPSSLVKDNIYEVNVTDGILDENLDCTLNLEEKGYLGQDGTEVGVYGGDNPFSESPTTPTVDAKNSSVEYDAASNKLKVTITVKPN